MLGPGQGPVVDADQTVVRSRGLRTMIGHVLAENHGMLKLCASLGFAFVESADGPTVRRAELALEPPARG